MDLAGALRQVSGSGADIPVEQSDGGSTRREPTTLIAAPITASESAQLEQTIEMFEVITQSQPLDYQSLEILKEAYAKLQREDEVVTTSKRIAQAYVQLGQFSSAILEYESILQQRPDDPDVQKALAEIEAKATSMAAPLAAPESDGHDADHGIQTAGGPLWHGAAPVELDDGRSVMHKVFVEGKLINPADFDACWPRVDAHAPVTGVREPLIQALEDRGFLPLEKSLKLLCDRARIAYLPLDRYDTDVELTRRFPREACLRWCVFPFDRMSKSVLVATANPFNRAAASELEAAGSQRLVWYMARPVEISKLLRKVFR